VALAQFIFESNTFNPVAAGPEVFTRGGTWLTETGAVRAWCATTDSQLAGSLGVLEAAGCDTQPVWVAMCSTPAGRLSAECWQTIRSTFASRLRAALPADAILLHLHGAVCAIGEDDVEGNLLELVRAELGFTGRLVVSLDLHANVTRRMLAHADAVTAYRTMPHLDFRATGERAAALVLQPGSTVRTLVKVAALVPPTDTDHTTGNFAAILQGARQLETLPGVREVSLFPVQPWLDVAELGTSVVLTSDAGSGAEAAAAGRTLAESWYAQRRQWRTGVRSWDEIRATLRTRGARPWILVDSADATTGGSSGASAEAVAQLWAVRHELPGEVLLWVVDAAAHAAAMNGARHFRLGLQGWAVDADVIHSGDGRYRARGRAYTGQEFSMGPAVVLQAGQLRIVVSSGAALGADPAFYECLGLRPDTALAVHVKSPMGWRAGYDATASQGLTFDGPGCTSLNFARLPYTGERRELFPICADPATPVTLWQSG
jgi:microcystin degradation protein MlrC